MSSAVVLVHGAWHGAWCFDRVLPLLRNAGVDAIAIDLPGHGGDTGTLTDLHGDAARVRDVLDRVDGTVVLLGHSYGGAVITEAGSHAAVAYLLYLAAFAIDVDESCATAAAREPDVAAISHEGRPNFGRAFVRHDDGTITLAPHGAAECLYNDCDGDTIAWALARLGPQLGVTLTQSPTEVAWRRRPSTYVICADDQAVHPDLQRVLSRRCTHSVEWNTGHSPMASRPEAVANLLIDLC